MWAEMSNNSQMVEDVKISVKFGVSVSLFGPVCWAVAETFASTRIGQNMLLSNTERKGDSNTESNNSTKDGHTTPNQKQHYHGAYHSSQYTT